MEDLGLGLYGSLGGSSEATVTNTTTKKIIKDSTNGNVIYLKNEGYTEQKTLSGKNLLKLSANEYTSGGVTFKANVDGSVVANGTSTTTFTGCFINLLMGAGKLNNGEEYIFSIETANDNLAIYGLYNTADDGSYKAIFAATSTSVKATIPEDALNIIIRIVCKSSSVTLTNAICYPMIRLASVEDDTYEPYCGGIASPNPDYPQRIEAWGDKGYFDGKLVQGYYDNSGVLTASDNCVSSTNIIPCDVGDIINVKYEEIITVESGVPFIIVFFDKDKKFVTRTLGSSGTDELTATAPTNASYFLFSIGHATATSPSNAKHISVTINGNYAIPVKTTGKNIFGGLALAQAIVNSGSTTVTVDESAGTVTFAKNTNYKDKDKTLLFDNFKENTQYTFILDGTADVSEGYTNLLIKYSDGTQKTLYLTNKLTVSEKGKTISRLIYTYVGGTTTLNYNQCGIFEGVITEEEFEEYQETVANIPITEPLYEGDYIDVYADGSGREYHKMSSAVLDGSDDENFGLQSINSYGIANFYIHLPSLAKTETAISNRFMLQKTLISDTTREGIYNNEDLLYIRINQERESTIADFKAWLQSNPIHVVYELKEPTSTPLTAEQVAEFMKLQTFKGVTHVTADGEVTMRYYCDTDGGEMMAMLQSQINALNEKINILENNS